MKHLLIFVLISFVSKIDAVSQTTLNLDEIRKMVEDSTAVANYSSLVDAFNTDPLTLDDERGAIIYYGKLFSGYDAYKINFNELDFSKLVLKKKYKQAIEKGEELIKTDPVNLEILSKLILCYDKADIKDKAELTKAKVSLLIASILKYGDGLSESRTLKIISVGDEYAMMGILGVTGLSRKSKISGKSAFDTWKAKDPKGKRIDFFAEVLYPPAISSSTAQ